MTTFFMAIRNLKKNFSFYSLYLISVAFVITVFFAFTSFSVNTVMLEKMEKNNLIRRITDENDKRKLLVILTNHAKSLKKCSDKISDEMTKKMYEGFSEEEIDKFEEYLHRIIKNFEEKRKVIDDDKSIDKIIDRRL